MRITFVKFFSIIVYSRRSVTVSDDRILFMILCLDICVYFKMYNILYTNFNYICILNFLNVIFSYYTMKLNKILS